MLNEGKLSIIRYSMRIPIQAGTMKTAINSLKTIRKRIDVSLKSFCGGLESPIRDTQKDFFPQGQLNTFAIENRIPSRASRVIEMKSCSNSY